MKRLLKSVLLVCSVRVCFVQQQDKLYYILPTGLDFVLCHFVLDLCLLEIKSRLNCSGNLIIDRVWSC